MLFRSPPPAASSKPDDPVMSLLKEISGRLADNEAYCRDLGKQMSQLAREMQDRPQGSLPSNTEQNPRGGSRESAKAITLRGGKTVEQPIPKVIPPQPAQVSNESGEVSNPDSVPNPPPIVHTTERTIDPPKPYVPKLPYPQRKDRLDQKYAKFLEVFTKLEFNLPLIEALQEMPTYAKFFKELLAGKRKLGEKEVVALTEECSTIISNRLPPKITDRGSFTIPCKIGNLEVVSALCDLGASINLMPLSFFRKLGLGAPKPTNMTLQLADRSITRPKGVVEDVLVKVDKFIFPVDFVVIDMEEDIMVPLLLGRPFLATGRTLIDVQEGKIILRLQDEEVTFQVYDAIKHPLTKEDCKSITTFCSIDACVVDSVCNEQVTD